MTSGGTNEHYKYVHKNNSKIKHDKQLKCNINTNNI